jgi:methylthioribose-1-phosphate isomerase
VKINGKQYRSVWFDATHDSIGIFDQTLLPHRFETLALATLDQVCHAIVSMQVRGAPLIGAVAAYGYAVALQRDASDESLQAFYSRLFETRPTAVNLRWALDRVRAVTTRSKGAGNCTPAC